MIKINLVPLKEKKRQQEYVFMLVGAVAVVILLAGMFWFYIQKVQVKRDLNVQIRKVDEESKSYADKIAEVTAFEDTEAKLEAANKSIKDIQIGQKKIIYAIDQLGLNLTSGVWFTAVNQNADGFVIAGYSFSLGELKNYYENLVRVPGFSKDAALELKNITASIGNNKQIVQFEITTKVTDTEQ